MNFSYPSLEEPPAPVTPEPEPEPQPEPEPEPSLELNGMKGSVEAELPKEDVEELDETSKVITKQTPWSPSASAAKPVNVSARQPAVTAKVIPQVCVLFDPGLVLIFFKRSACSSSLKYLNENPNLN